MFGFSRKFALGGVVRPEMELHFEPITRPCEVDGKTCLFHRFVEESKLVLCGNTFVRPLVREVWSRRLRDDGMYKSPDCVAEVIRTTFALIEFPDGSLAKVDPVEVTFLDRTKNND